MRNYAGFTPATRFLLVSASFVIVVAGLRAASAIIIPLLLAAVFAMLASSLMFWLRQQGVPKVLALALMILIVVVVGIVVTNIIVSSLTELSERVPFYYSRLREEEDQILLILESFGFDTSSVVVADMIEPGPMMQTLTGILTRLGSLFTNSFLILFTVIFILLEASSFPAKLRVALGDRHMSLEKFQVLSEGIRNYLVIKTLVSMATGASVMIMLLLFNIDFALLWGFIAFLLNYIPNIGSFVASLPAIALGLVLHGVDTALLIALGYFIINQILGGFIEPRFLGEGLKLSPLVVFLSLIFWGWVLGPVGLLLAVPLTLLVKIILESSAETHWIALLLEAAPKANTPTLEREVIGPPARIESLSDGIERRIRGDDPASGL